MFGDQASAKPKRPRTFNHSIAPERIDDNCLASLTAASHSEHSFPTQTARTRGQALPDTSFKYGKHAATDAPNLRRIRALALPTLQERTLVSEI